MSIEKYRPRTAWADRLGSTRFANCKYIWLSVCSFPYLSAGVMQKNDSTLQNDPWVISLRRGLTRVIILRREMTPECRERTPLPPPVVEFCKGGSFSALHRRLDQRINGIEQ